MFNDCIKKSQYSIICASITLICKLWREKEVQNLLQRIKGKTENGVIYVHYGGNLRIPVRPVYLGGLRSGCSMEEVSFFLGFTMEGPVAYDIKYTTDL